jgi:hypothetical protein
MLARLLASGDPFNDNPLFSLLSRCADRTDLSAMLEALARPPAGREPLEIEGAIEAALRSPALTSDVAKQLIVDHFQAVRDSGARASLSYLLGRRSAVDALNRILRDDPDPYVRAAAVVSLRDCKTPPAFATLWRAAKSDPDSYVRAQAYQTLGRFGQLRTRDDLLAASRNQTDAGSVGRFLGRWLKAGETPEDQTAETFTSLAEHTGSSEASGALSEIFRMLQPAPKAPVVMTVRPPPLPLPISPGPSQATVMAPIQSIPIASAAQPEDTELQRALYRRSERITRAALAQFAASKNLREDAARVAIDCALVVNRCDQSGCEHLNNILRATDRMRAPLALEASHDVSTQVGSFYFAYRYRQYVILFSLASLVAVAAVVAGFVRRRERTFATGAGLLLMVAATAAFQLTSGPIWGVSVWPPPYLWPATALGSIAATLVVAVPVTLACWRKRMIPAALIAGEIGWWFVPSLLAAAGLTLRMQHYSTDEDWLPFLLMILMLVGGPILTLMFSAAAWGIEHIVLPQPLEH